MSTVTEAAPEALFARVQELQEQLDAYRRRRDPRDRR